MIGRSIVLTLCLALFCLGPITGCAPRVGDGSSPPSVQTAPTEEGGLPADPSTTSLSDEDSSESEIPEITEPAPPSTTTPVSEIPAFGE